MFSHQFHHNIGIFCSGIGGCLFRTKICYYYHTNNRIGVEDPCVVRKIGERYPSVEYYVVFWHDFSMEKRFSPYAQHPANVGWARAQI